MNEELAAAIARMLTAEELTALLDYLAILEYKRLP